MNCITPVNMPFIRERERECSIHLGFISLAYIRSLGLFVYFLSFIQLYSVHINADVDVIVNGW